MNISNEYRKSSIKEFYSNKCNQKNYSNPHSDCIINCLNTIKNRINYNNSVLDLCCGDGLVTKWLAQNNINNVCGCDPFMYERYTSETNKKCYNYTFEQLGNFDFNIDKVDFIICSYAFDLIPKSYINKVLYALSQIGGNLVLIRPNSKLIEYPAWKLDAFHKNMKSRISVYTISD